MEMNTFLRKCKHLCNNVKRELALVEKRDREGELCGHAMASRAFLLYLLSFLSPSSSSSSSSSSGSSESRVSAVIAELSRLKPHEVVRVIKSQMREEIGEQQVMTVAGECD
jgi:hypothetical protein